MSEQGKSYGDNVYVTDHPLIQHKITILRNKNTNTSLFRFTVEEISMMMCYEALRDIPTRLIDVETPLEKCQSPRITGKKIAVVPVLRAGLGMANGMLRIYSEAKMGHVGMERDESTHEPHEYYCKLPKKIEERLILVVDPMLATGGSAIDAIDKIKEYGGKKIKFICIIAAPEGIEKLHAAHPDVDIYIGHIDRELNENAYICPGLGDAGDRIFGTL